MKNENRKSNKTRKPFREDNGQLISPKENILHYKLKYATDIEKMIIEADEKGFEVRTKFHLPWYVGVEEWRVSIKDIEAAKRMHADDWLCHSLEFDSIGTEIEYHEGKYSSIDIWGNWFGHNDEESNIKFYLVKKADVEVA